MKEKESRFIKCDEPARGASGDIGFTPKASNINGLRAIEQQYLRQNQIAALDFEGRSGNGASFFLAQKKSRKSLSIDQIFPYAYL